MPRHERPAVFSVPQLYRFYRHLFAHLGPQHWWPGRTRFEVILGAILTQNTNWVNVEKTLRNLRRASSLGPRGLARLPQAELARLLRPSGYFRQKARRLGHFLDFLQQRYQGSLSQMFRAPTARLRAELLALNGIGEETADSILLYAGRRPVFVIDAYTRRILQRHRLACSDAPYRQLQKLFEDHLPRDPQLYNEYHALLVAVGKRYCHRLQPACRTCPLGPELEKPYGTA